MYHLVDETYPSRSIDEGRANGDRDAIREDRGDREATRGEGEARYTKEDQASAKGPIPGNKVWASKAFVRDGSCRATGTSEELKGASFDVRI